MSEQAQEYLKKARRTSKRCEVCAIDLTDREWDEGNGTQCYDCRIGALEARIRRLEGFVNP